MDARAAALHALILVVEALRATIDEMGEQGAPAGILFIALMERFPTMTATDFDRITGILVEGGAARREGDVFYTTRKFARPA